MREIRPSGSEGGVALTTPSLPLSFLKPAFSFDRREACGTLRAWHRPVYQALDHE